MAARARDGSGAAESVAARRDGRIGTRWAALTGVPRRLAAVAGAAAGLTAVVAAGPVAGIIAVVYTSLAVHVILRQRAVRAAARQRRDRLDGLGAMAADLRAGLPMPHGTVAARAAAGTSSLAGIPASAGVPGRPSRRSSPDRIEELVQAAGQLAERTGAPLADLLDRIEADARATDRGLAAAAAQAAGSRATAWLLAVLPLGGIALGYAIGVDPVGVLLHTPIGAVCAIAALLLQLGGLAWSDRLNATTSRMP